MPPTLPTDPDVPDSGIRFVPPWLHDPALLSVGLPVTRNRGSKPPDGFPPHGSMTDIPLPSAGSPQARFPCFHGTMKMCDSLGPSRRASFPSLGNTRRCVGTFAPCGPARPTAGLGFVIRSPPPDFIAWRPSGPPKVPGESHCAYALFSDPGRTDVTRPLRWVGAAPVRETTKAPASR